MESIEEMQGARVRVILRQGIKRQIRLMFYELGYEVVKLRRIRIGPLGLGRLKAGEWRMLDMREVMELRSHKSAPIPPRTPISPASPKAAPTPRPTPSAAAGAPLQRRPKPPQGSERDPGSRRQDPKRATRRPSEAASKRTSRRETGPSERTGRRPSEDSESAPRRRPAAARAPRKAAQRRDADGPARLSPPPATD